LDAIKLGIVEAKTQSKIVTIEINKNESGKMSNGTLDIKYMEEGRVIMLNSN
jgi:hypothetical protein